jgi:thiamine-phosphate pyrophosphorylase
MRSSKKLLAAAKLYLILDTQVLDYGALLQVLKDSVRGGIDIVQLRDKIGSTKEILDFCRKVLKITKHQIPFIVNDRADLAFFSGADGLHLGQEDLEYSLALRLLGKNKIIGVSCQNLQQAIAAEALGADYIGFGSVFQTQTKPDRQAMDLDILQKVIKKVKIPIFPIGGISRRNIGQLISLGVTRVAVCRDILLASNPFQVVRELKVRISTGGDRTRYILETANDNFQKRG